jgi:hypothetical protein
MSRAATADLVPAGSAASGARFLRRRGSFMSGQFLGSHGLLQLTMVS